MGYMQENYTRHREYVEKEMEGYSTEQQGDVVRQLANTWPNDDEVKKLIADKKAEIANEASPEEIAEAFKNLRI